MHQARELEEQYVQAKAEVDESSARFTEPISSKQYVRVLPPLVVGSRGMPFDRAMVVRRVLV